ncbi:MAG: pyrroline-5-carboxylate reductase [Bryobacteraceae bacterium]|nr:pyrroline-5-carboxylate reductase [Bryobacteraceae bacterium]
MARKVGRAKIAILGAGNMGSSLLGGLLKSGFAKPGEVIATVRSEERAAELRARYRIRATAGGNAEAAEAAEIVILAVKPGTIPKVVSEIRDVLRGDQILLSLAAAVPIAVIEKRLARKMAVFRAMPNIPVVVEEGAIAICANGAAKGAQWKRIEALFRTVGVVTAVDEEMMDAVTALSGSGPAYVYMVIEAFIAGGVKMGLSRQIATKLAEQTVLGAAKHVRQSGLHPAILRDEVITPGGTTIVAIHELERNGLRSTLISAIETATKHAKERAQALVQKLEAEG